MQQQWRQTRKLLRAVAISQCWRSIIGALLSAAFCAGTPAWAQEGKALFEANCAACHSIGGGAKAGPDLKDVVAKRGKDGTLASVLDPAKAGLKPSMPNLGLSRKNAEAIVAFLDPKHDSGSASAAGKESATAQAAASTAAPHEIQLGQDLFEGKVRFTKGGPSCNACHDVRSDKVVAGGILASELTLAFSRMGKQGLQSVIANAPFPAMQVAYQGKDLSEKEVAALIGFLQQVEKDHSRQMPRETGVRMLTAGVGGVIVLLGIFSLAGRRRKKRCVNQDIYDRQIKSE
jgi:mono/diheme cytochrome c family protein